MNQPAKILLSISLPLLSAASAWADGRISGQVVNKSNGLPLDFATVQLFSAKGEPLPIGTETDLEGRFTLPSVKDGKYIVKVTSVGSIDQERPVTVASQNVNIGEIQLADDTKLLQEVVVEGIRSQMRFELDKKVFQVDANITAAGTSASELLESIPSVEVDQDGEVSLRGNSSVTIWINGKESGLTADNRAQILEQIPAETIESIEVITNPSAKYSPEGTSGIINIVLKKDRRGGYFGSAEIGANTRGGGNVNANFNFNSPKWETFASVGYRMRHNSGGSLSRRSYDNGLFLNSDGSNRRHGNNVFLRAGATFHITEADQVSANAFGMFGHMWGHSETLYTANIPGQWATNNDYSRNKNDMRNGHVEIGYRHDWSKTHSLDFTLGYSHWGGPWWNSFHENHTFDDDGVTPDYDLYQEQDQHINSNNVETKLDYTNQILPWLKLESGFQGNYNHENTPVTTRQGTEPGNLQVAEDLYNRFIYTNNISALYFTLGGKWQKLSFSAGLRGEAWQIRTKSLGYGVEPESVSWFKRDKFALFPSAFLSYSLPMDNELQINYTRRIRRPWGGMLNSFRDISNPSNISYGNPELEPEYSNSFELNYLKSWTMHMLSVSAYLRQSSNNMNRISYLNDNVMYTTWDNVGSQVNSGVEIVSKNSLFRCLDLTTTVNLYNNHISAWQTTYHADGKTFELKGDSRNSFAWDARMMASVKLPWGMSFQATGRYASKNLTAQGSRQGGWSVDLGLRKNLGDWSFAISCRDLFDSRKFKSTIDGTDYTQHDERWRGGRTLRLTIKYSFGNMKAKQNHRNDAEPVDNSGYGETEF